MHIDQTTRLGAVTHTSAPNFTAQRWDIYGTDLGFIWDAGRDGVGTPRVFVMFGDTYGQGWTGPGPGPSDANWRKNTLTMSTNRNLEQGLLLDSAVTKPPNKDAVQVIKSRPRWVELTVIPNSGITVDGVHVAQWMSIRSWNLPPRLISSHAGMAISTDDGLSWRRETWWGNLFGQAKFQICCFAQANPGDWVYLFGTSSGRYGPGYLARVRPSDVTVKDAYRYFDGTGWTSDQRRCVPVLDGNLGEHSVVRHEQYGWLAMHLDEERAAIVLRRAPAPTGPWSTGDPVVTAEQYPGLYGGYIHPWCLSGGPLYWTLSMWNDYRVYWMRTAL